VIPAVVLLNKSGKNFKSVEDEACSLNKKEQRLEIIVANLLKGKKPR
jgi:hypothetical protein